MKDKAINSLAKANAKSKLAKEGANASRNKSGVGRRSSYSGGLSSSKVLNQFNAGRSIANSISSSGSQELSEKQQKQQQRLNRAIKVAEKIPFLNKYAKIAKAAQKVTEMKGKGGKILGGMSGGKPASGEEAEDMLAAEQRGEEYKPDQTEQKFTVFSKRQLIISAVLICSGIFIILILIAVITMSSITDTAGEAYLASKDTPTEEELAEAYGAQDGESSGESSDGTSGVLDGDSVSGSGKLSVYKKLMPDNDKPSGVYEISSEPEPWSAINYHGLGNDKYIYPIDKSTNLMLGAWPKNYSSIPTQLSGCKLYQNNFIWPTTPSDGTYQTVYNHNGIDIMADFGTPIYSPCDAKLVYSEWGHTTNKGSDETAYSVTLEPTVVKNFNGVEISTIFLTHMSGIRYRCETGKCNRTVKRGELLGFVGTAAGSATSAGFASHLHATYYPGDDYSSGIYTNDMEKLYSISDGTKRKACE